MNNTIGIDQYGNAYLGLGKYPRKALLEKLGATYADKMYTDLTDGGARHKGYVVNGLWISLYAITPFGKTLV